MSPTEHHTKPASTSKSGIFATLRGLPCVQGSGAPARALLATPLATLAVLFGAFAFMAAPAVAAVPETPEPGKVSAVTATTATFEGFVLNPHAPGEAGSYQFEYALQTQGECGSASTVAPEPPGIELGIEKEVVLPLAVTNLEPNTRYIVCLFEEFNAVPPNSLPSNAVSFETLRAKPTILNETVTETSPSEPRLEAVVNPSNESAECHFQYGTGSVSEHELPCEQPTVSGGQQSVGVNLPSPTQLTTYRYRVLVKNAIGTAEGAPQEFTTVAPEPPEAKPATAITHSTAKLNGVLNPKHAGEAGAYEFVYRQSFLGCQGEGQMATTPAKANGVSPESVPAEEVSGLQPGAQYTFCLLARSKGGAVAVSQPVTFTTEALPPTIAEESEPFSNAGSSSVTLRARVSPDGAPATYFFEYGPTTAYGSVTPTHSAGAGLEVVSVQETLSGLQPETTYHFRVVAINAKGTVGGGDSSFSTFPVGTLGLPDGRGYELVSPLEVGDETALPGPLVRAAADGSAVTYSGTSPPVGGIGKPGFDIGSRPGGSNLYLATRSASGWTSSDIQPAGLASAGYVTFSGDLSVGILSSSEALIEGAPSGEDLYTRNDGDGSYQLLGVGANYEGATADDSHILVKSAGGLYDSVGGRLEPVSVLPGEGEAVANVTFGSAAMWRPEGLDLERVISADGSRIFWSTVEEVELPRYEVEERSKALYVRENDSSPQSPLGPKNECLVTSDACTVQLDASEGPGPSGGGRFLTANSEGSKVFFTDVNRLTSGSNAGPGAPDLYEYDFDKPAGERLLDLTARTENLGEHADVVGVLGASEDGSYLYFAAGGALANTGANQQECIPPDGSSQYEKLTRCNIYVVHEGEAPKLVTTVAESDGAGGDVLSANRNAYAGDWVPNVGYRFAHVTPDGRRLVFESSEDLTGFDSQGSREIYMYDVGTGVSCVSCNPGGIPTIHLDDEPEVVHAPPAELPLSGTTTYQLRDLSSDGDRVFFESSEALVSQNTNENQPIPAETVALTKVYEWEREGTPEGSCPAKASPRSDGGCLFLLSEGTSSDISLFLDASENGNDVFILTRADLVAQDKGETFEVYDARVGAPQRPTPPACTGSGCQGVPGAPPIFATPSSVTFSGIGNFPPPSTSTKISKKTDQCPKGKKLSHGRCLKKKPNKTKAKRSIHRKGSK